jgi:hypothetical protein
MKKNKQDKLKRNHNLNINNNRPEFEIIGLHLNSEGQSCSMHSHCGMHVQAGDAVLLIHYVVTIREGAEPEDAINKDDNP